MLNFEFGKIKLISVVTADGAPIEMASPVELIIRNSDTGLYWNDSDAFVSSPFSHTMTYDAVAQYYLYVNSNLVLQGLYEAIFVSSDTENPFRVIEQFLIIPALYNPTDIADAVWASIVEGSMTFTELNRIMLAFATGLSDATQKPGHVKYRDLADTKDRIDALHSTDGDRTSVTLDGS